MASGAIDRLAVVLSESGHSEGTARALAANTVRQAAATGTSPNGDRIRSEVREAVAAEVAAHERSRSGILSEAARALARLERSGGKLSASEAGGVAQRLAHRATVAEGLLLSLDTPRGHEAAVQLVGRETADATSLERLLRETARDDGFVAEVLGFPVARSHTALAEAPESVVARGSTGPVGTQGPVAKARPVAKQTRGGVRKGRGRKAGVVDPKQAAEEKTFEKLHPRQRQGAPTGGQFMKKGEGMQTEQGSDRVRLLQNRLSELGQPIVSDGRFGANTEEALREFQKKYGLKETGVVDSATVESLRNPPPLTRAEVEAAMEEEANPKKAAATKSKTSKKAKKKAAPGGRERQAGNAGVSQEVWSAATGEKSGGDKTYREPSGGASGASGRSTSAAGSSSGTASTRGGTTAQMARRGDGMSGDPDPEVESMQQLLSALGYDLGKAGVDGRFGEDTEAAVRKFQQRAGLRVDGVAGPQTKAMLRRKMMAKRRESERKDVGEAYNRLQPRSRRGGPKGGKWVDWSGHGDDAPRARALGKASPAGGSEQIPVTRDGKTVAWATSHVEGENRFYRLRATTGTTMSPKKFASPAEAQAHYNKSFGGKPSPAAGGDDEQAKWDAAMAKLRQDNPGFDQLDTFERDELMEKAGIGQDPTIRKSNEAKRAVTAAAPWKQKVAKIRALRAAELAKAGQGVTIEELDYADDVFGDSETGPSIQRAIRKGTLGGYQLEDVLDGLQKSNPVGAENEALRDSLVKKLKRVKLKEASYVSVKPPTPMGTRVPYGGVVPALTTGVEVERPDGKLPPKLRQATGWHRCGNCVHFDGELQCLLYKWPVDHDDLCSSHLTLSPQARHGAALQEAREQMDAARKSRDGGAFARARARAKYHQVKLGEEEAVGLQETDSRSLPDLPNKPGKTNWVERAGGLPKYIERIAKHLHHEKGMQLGRAIATAVNVVKKMCASGDTNFPGKQSVNAKSRAEACAAVASWEAKKKGGRLREAATSRLERQPIGKGHAGYGFARRTILEVEAIDALPEGERPEYLQESVLTAEKRKRLPKSEFAIPPDRYPIHDEAHARNALSRVAQHGSPAEKARVKAAVRRRYPHIGRDVREGRDVEEGFNRLQPRARRGGPHGGSWVDWFGHGPDFDTEGRSRGGTKTVRTPRPFKNATPTGEKPAARFDETFDRPGNPGKWDADSPSRDEMERQLARGRAAGVKSRGGKSSPAAGGHMGVPGALDPDAPETRHGTVVELSPLHDGQMKTFEEMGIKHPSYFSTAAAAKKAGQAMLQKHKEPVGFHTRKLLANVPGKGSGRVRNLHLELRDEGGGKASPSAGGPSARVVGTRSGGRFEMKAGNERGYWVTAGDRDEAVTKFKEMAASGEFGAELKKFFGAKSTGAKS